MMTRCERDPNRADVHGFPRVHFVDFIKSEVRNEVPNPVRNNDWLGSSDPPQSSPVQMVEMRVRNEHKIDRWEVMQQQPGTPNPLDDFQPERPDWIHQNIKSTPANEK